MHLHLARELRPPVRDQGHVGGRAPHVEGDQIAKAGGAPDLQAAHHARGRPGQHRPHRLDARRLEGHHAAIALGDMGRRRDPHLAQARAEPLEIAGEHRSEVGVHHDRRQPLVLAELRRDLVRARHEDAGALLLDDAARRLLVARVDVAVEEAHGDRPRARDTEGARRLAHLGQVERRLDAPVVAQPLPHLVPARAGDEHPRLVGLQIVEMGPALAADLEQVAEALGGDEARVGAAMLDQRIGGDGGAVAEVVDRGRRGLRRLAEALDDAVGDGARRVVRRARHLPDADVTGGGVDEADVGERASRVDADAPHVRCPLSGRVPCDGRAPGHYARRWRQSNGAAARR